MLSTNFQRQNDLIREISNDIIENDNAELPLMRRNGIELLTCMSSALLPKILEIKMGVPWELTAPVTACIGLYTAVSYIHTLIKREPYQDRSIELGKELHRECRKLKKEFPKASWKPKQGCYSLPEPKVKSAPIIIRAMDKARYITATFL